MSSLYLELAVIVALIVLNGILACAELAVVSSRRTRLKTLVERDVVGSRRALALASNPGKFLSTVQIGITLVGVLSGAFSGATIGQRLAEGFSSLGLSDATAEIVGTGIAVAMVTYVSLIVGELVPKQVALRDPERIAVMVAPAMTVLAKAASPVVYALDASGRAMLRLLGQTPQSGERVSEEEIRTLIAEAETAGILDPGERAMITAVMRLGDRPVQAIMVPRGQVDMIDVADDPSALRMRIADSIHSRLPVCENGLDKMLGVIQVKDVAAAYLRGEEPEIRELIRQAPLIPDSANALDVVQIIRRSPIHLAFVLDEYGNFEGVVTNADILEAVVGEFRTEKGFPEPDAVQREDGSWLISGSMPVDEMAERLSIDLPQERSYHTAAGFALSHMHALPAVGETADLDGWRLEILELDGRRVDKILASRLPTVGRRAIG